MKLTKFTYRLLLILAVAVVPPGIDPITTQAISPSRAKDTPESSNSSGHLPVPPNVTSTQTGERVEVELVALLPKGFQPAEITRPNGRFVFGVNNRTGLEELTLQLVPETGRAVEGKRMSKKKAWRKIVDLPPGHYLLRVVGHPDWQCRITITQG